MFLLLCKSATIDFESDVLGLFSSLEEAKEAALDFLSDYNWERSVVIYNLNIEGEFVLPPRELQKV